MTTRLSVDGRSVPVYNPNGQVVGRITGGVLRKEGLDLATHKLKRPPALATDTDHLRQLRECGGTEVEFVTRDGDVWQSTLDDWDRYAIVLDRGHGEQAALPDRYWKRNGKPAAACPASANAPAAAEPAELSHQQLRLAIDG